MRGSVSHNIEILPGRLRFSVLRKQPRSSNRELYFSIENEPHFKYNGFFHDFGPPSLLHVFSFVNMIEEYMSKSSVMLHFYVSTNPESRSNSCFLITAFRMIHLKVSPEEAFRPIKGLGAQLKPFRDASTLPSSFDLTVLDCLRGLHRGMTLGWFDVHTFDPEKWAKLEQIENGDMNWLVPHKLLAFASPYDTNIIPGGYRVATPQDLVPTFKELGITHVIRLNKKFYDQQIFVDSGFKHTELYFLDGSVPPKHILDSFLEIAEGSDVIALHCKAGLGRTYFSLLTSEELLPVAL